MARRPGLPALLPARRPDSRHCPGYGTDRLLPGLDNSGSPVCVDCAGIPADFHCTQCPAEEEPYRARRCARCCLRDHMAELLDDGTGTVPESLRPLQEGICAQLHPRSDLTWLRNPDVRDLLASIATGARPLAHTTFDAHPSPRTAMHLRELFIEHGLLEPMDRNLLHFETWLDRILAEITDPDHHALIKQFATWHHLHRMRQLSVAGQLQWGSARAAKQDISVARDFLRHLSERGKLPSQCRQADVDHWLATGPTTRSMARTFVRWAVRNQHLRLLEFPYRKAETRPVLDQNERLRLLRETLKNGDRALHHRAAAVLLLLYAQPLTRIARMRLDQISRTDDGEAVVVFDDEPVPVPPTLRRNPSTTPRQPAQHEHRSRPRLAVALPRIPPRTAPPPRSHHEKAPRKRHPHPWRQKRRASRSRPHHAPTRCCSSPGLQHANHRTTR